MRLLALALLVLLGSPSAADDTGLGAALNAFRAASGRAALAEHPAATRAAAAHASDMARRGYFAHRGSDGSSVGDRLIRAGCRWTAVGENLAQGQPTAAEVVAAWAASPGHRRNMLGRHEVFGAARAGQTWVLVLASGC
jgi:uncharacterized protein YkwD